MSDKKKFLFVSLDALISDIAWQVRAGGHEVRYFIASESERDIADGFVYLSSDDASWVTGTPLVIDGGLVTGIWGG